MKLMELRRQWWLGVVAALVAAVYLFDSVGYAAGVGLVVVTVAGVIGYRWYRRRNPPPDPVVRCLRCGEALSRTARNCKACGSASWTLEQ